MDDYVAPLLDFLTGKFPYAMECTILGQAFFGAMAVKGGRNKHGELHWFHAFVLSAVTGFAGGLFNFMWLGMPTSMISNDVVFASCVVAFSVVNFIPLDLGYKFGDFLPVKIVITMFAMLFRSLGMVGFTTAAFNKFQESPSKYYPIPVFGPIWYGIMLGNMGGFVSKGIDGYLAGGIPWPFQCGMFCAPLFHFYVHDKTGPIGENLRAILAPAQDMVPGVDERAFATAFVSLFMQVAGILQLPAFLGPSFSPFVSVHNLINAPLNAVLTEKDRNMSYKTRDIVFDEAKTDDSSQVAKPTGNKNKKPKRKKGKQKSS